MLNQNELNDLINQIINNKKLRIEATRKNHFLFFNVYLPHYVQYPTAQFHKEMFDLTQDQQPTTLVICAFRGSGKSTLMSLSYPLWSIMGDLQKKHVLITSKTQDMAKRILENLKGELTNNELLKADMGPFRSTDSRWGGGTIELSRYQARIVVASVEEGIRGIRYGTHRPDLIICDDIEDLNSVTTQEGRNKTYRWFKGDLVPTGDKKTNIVVIGNLLHDDSLLMRLRKEISDGTRDGTFKFYPLLDDHGNCLWPGKYSTPADIEAERRKVADDIEWHREFLLTIISDAERVIQKSWIQYWDKLPDQTPGTNNPRLRHIAMAVDLAISEKSTAHYTAIVNGVVYGHGKEMVIYILPNPTNKRLDFPTAVQTVEDKYLQWMREGYKVDLCFDSTAYQAAFGQELANRGIKAHEFVNKAGKRARLHMTSPLIQIGRVLFPREGAEELIHQMVGFGREKYDDLVDAFAMLILRAMENNKSWYMPIALVAGSDGHYYLRPKSTPNASTENSHSRKRGTLRYDMDNSDPHGWGPAARRW